MKNHIFNLPTFDYVILYIIIAICRYLTVAINVQPIK